MYDYRPYVRKVYHGKQIAFECSKGYQINGPPSATCLNGMWSPSQLPVCLKSSYMLTEEEKTSIIHNRANVWWVRSRSRRNATEFTLSQDKKSSHKVNQGKKTRDHSKVLPSTNLIFKAFIRTGPFCLFDCLMAAADSCCCLFRPSFACEF